MNAPTTSATSTATGAGTCQMMSAMDDSIIARPAFAPTDRSKPPASPESAANRSGGKAKSPCGERFRSVGASLTACAPYN